MGTGLEQNSESEPAMRHARMPCRRELGSAAARTVVHADGIGGFDRESSNYRVSPTVSPVTALAKRKRRAGPARGLPVRSADFRSTTMPPEARTTLKVGKCNNADVVRVDAVDHVIR